LILNQGRPIVSREGMSIAPRQSPVPGDSAMTSQRWSTLVSGLVLTLALAAGGRAEAQFVFSGGIPGYSSAGAFDPGDGAVIVSGLSPFNYGSFAGVGFGGLGQIGAFPLPGYGRSIGRRPLTTTSFQPLSSGITSLSGWNGRLHGVRRRH
jgi:hypothetical protein